MSPVKEEGPRIQEKIFVVKVCIDNSGRNYGITLDGCKALPFKPIMIR